jgi:hypothetical protein
MPNERVVHAREFAKDKHPGIVGIEVLYAGLAEAVRTRRQR